MGTTANPTLIVLLICVGSALGLLLGGLVLFAIVRGAVLSALRRHHEELRQAERERPL